MSTVDDTADAAPVAQHRARPAEEPPDEKTAEEAAAEVADPDEGESHWVGASSYRALDCGRILSTLATLRLRIEERFPGSSLSRLCAELEQLGRQAEVRTASIAKPIIALRVASAVLTVAIAATTVAVFLSARLPNQSMSAPELIQVLEAAINDAVLIGAAIFFLVTIETRIRRRRTLESLHELRALAHIIDMHQLTKDPERIIGRGPSTPSSPRQGMTPFELSRYLDYCSEMLSLTGKLAALYVQQFDDEVALSAVNELEDLCTGLSRKIWQKIMILQTMSDQLETS